MVSENEFLYHALLMGAYITFVYDILRILRRVIPHSALFVSLEDLLFWIYCGAEVFLMMYHESNGTLRWFAVLGAFAGMFLYKKLISGLLVKYTSLVLGKLLGAVGKILGFLLKPLGSLRRKMGRGAGKVRSRVHVLKKRLCRVVNLRLTFVKKMFRINLKA